MKTYPSTGPGFLNHQQQVVHATTYPVGAWTNTFEKYATVKLEIIFPKKIRGENKKIWEKPPPSVFLCASFPSTDQIIYVAFRKKSLSNSLSKVLITETSMNYNGWLSVG